MEVVEEEENFSNFGKFKGKVGSKIFRFFFRFSLFFPTRGSGGGEFENFSFFPKFLVFP